MCNHSCSISTVPLTEWPTFQLSKVLFKLEINKNNSILFQTKPNCKQVIEVDMKRIKMETTCRNNKHSVFGTFVDICTSAEECGGQKVCRLTGKLGFGVCEAPDSSRTSPADVTETIIGNKLETCEIFQLRYSRM
ncbi:uncharacterized protein LOC134256427 [Saccostrea cucullata]|uniref:uncharacterized protein LOC134256427 n=1 Tax=Saccostrea cuccullata TaxID=36930 RepID=UPI002ED57AAF